MDLDPLTNDDVADILALLDSLPYDEFDLETPRFRLSLRRTPGGWTQSTHVTGPPGAGRWHIGPVLAGRNGTSTQPDSGGGGADGIEGVGGPIEAGAGTGAGTVDGGEGRGGGWG